MPNILIDTDILIDFLRGNPGARDYLVNLSHEYVCYCSVITVAELFAGMREEEKKATMGLIEGLHCLPVTQSIAELAGLLKRESKSKLLALDDCLIAATAQIEKASLATRNSKHYPFQNLYLKVPNYKT